MQESAEGKAQKNERHEALGKKTQRKSVGTSADTFISRERQLKPDIMALGALAGAMFLWSGTFIAMKVALIAFHPLVMMFIRMLVSAVILFPFTFKWLSNTRYSKGDWLIILILVLSEPCMYFLFEAYALRYTTAAQAGVITAMLPLMVGVSAFFVLNERLSRKTWIGFILALAGVCVLTLTGQDTSSAPNPILGNSLEFMAMGMACIYTLCVRKLPHFAPLCITGLQAFGGTLFFSLSMFVIKAPLPRELPDCNTLLALAYLSMATIVAYAFYNFGIKRIGAARAAAWMNLIPGITLGMGILLLGESLAGLQVLALIPLFGGILLSQLRSS